MLLRPLLHSLSPPPPRESSGRRRRRRRRRRGRGRERGRRGRKALGSLWTPSLSFPVEYLLACGR